MRTCPCLRPAGRRAPLLAAFARCVVIFWAAPVLAGPLADPTRPPLQPPVAASPALPHGAQAVRPVAEPRVLPQVQSVQVPELGPASAVIDGRLVQAGDRIGGAVIAAIDRQGVTLRPASAAGTTAGPERLWLLASGAKQPAGTLAETRMARYAPAAAPAAASAPLAQAANEDLPRQSTQDRTNPPARTAALLGKAAP